MKLALGTVQFGLDYGISNVSGRVSQQEIESILALSKKNNITLLDTASQYGSSEKALGDALQKNNYFSIITKTPSFSAYNSIDESHASELKNIFHQSLLNLNKKKCYGLLIHQADDLLKTGSQHLMDAILDLQFQGLVDKIGVSIYSENQIDQLLARYNCIDIIQLPINILDQRLIHSGHLKRLKERGIEIHARSIFLQGLLLMDAKKLNTFFNPFIPHLTHYFNTIALHKLSPLQAAILFIKQIQEVDCIIVGVTSAKELNEIIHAYDTAIDKKIDFSFAATRDEKFINPVNWRLIQ